MNYAADICMLVHNSVIKDGRVIREASTLARQGWRVVVIGIVLSSENLPHTETMFGFTIVRVNLNWQKYVGSGTIGKLLQLIFSIPATISCLRRAKAAVYHAHDFPALLLLFLAGIWRRPVVYDSHELFFDRFPPGFQYPLKYTFWLLRPIERRLARRAAASITVGDLVANHLQATLSIKKPLVIRNCVDLRVLRPPVPISRAAGQVLVAHSGNIMAGRHLLELVSALHDLPGHVTVALIGDGKLREALITHAQEIGVSDRLFIVSPVDPFNISTTLAQADIAVILITSTRKNYQFSLPNKFFEAVAAGLPIISSAIPEVERLVREYNLGLICDPTDPSAIAAAITSILQPENQARYRANAQRARAELTWEAEERKLVALYEEILGAS